MTTPQDMPPDKPVLDVQIDPPDPAKGIIYRFFTKLLGWGVFMSLFLMLIGLLVFIALGIYRGIIWLWPGGPLG